MCALGQVTRTPSAYSFRVAVVEGEVLVSKRNLLKHPEEPGSRFVMSRPTSKNSAVARRFGFDVLSCVAQGVEMGDCDAMLTLAQTLSWGEAKVQSALPGVVMRQRL